MLQPAEPQISDKTKLLRAARLVGFILLYVLVEVGIEALVPDHLSAAVKSNSLYVLGLAVGLIVLIMMIIRIGGMDLMSFTGEWKQQLFGIFSFFLSIKAAGLIGYLLFTSVGLHSENEGVMTLYTFLSFAVGVMLLAPFQFLAFRAYARRKGIPTWPNLPKE
jgi:hypothetical protein